jgi:hypothetical protein
MDCGRKEVDRTVLWDCREREKRRKGLPIALEKIEDLGHVLFVPILGF